MSIPLQTLNLQGIYCSVTKFYRHAKANMVLIDLHELRITNFQLQRENGNSFCWGAERKSSAKDGTRTFKPICIADRRGS
jgi:hypothetical protein